MLSVAAAPQHLGILNRLWIIHVGGWPRAPSWHGSFGFMDTRVGEGCCAVLRGWAGLTLPTGEALLLISFNHQDGRNDDGAEFACLGGLQDLLWKKAGEETINYGRVATKET